MNVQALRSEHTKKIFNEVIMWTRKIFKLFDKFVYSYSGRFLITLILIY